MPYRFRRKENVADGVRRIAREQIDRATQALTPPRGGHLSAEAIHEARKRLKMCRALVRLVREEIGDETFERENACFRDTGRKLSAARDARVARDALAALLKEKPKHSERFTAIKEALAEAARATHQAVPSRPMLARMRRELREAATRLDQANFPDGEWSAICPGLRRAYTRGRKMFERAGDGGDAERHHEWRKRVKDLWYDFRLLRGVWPGVMKGLSKQAEKLAALLGEDHDLTVLSQALTRLPSSDLDSKDSTAMDTLIDDRRCALRFAAERLGERLYSEKPGAFLRRIERYWHAWRGR